MNHPENEPPQNPEADELPTIPPGSDPADASSDSGATLPPRSDSGGGDEATLPPVASATDAQDLDTLPSSESAWKPGGKIRYFGDYELIDEIARGGMGVVYRAKQTSLNRVVALKMILAGQLAGEQEVQRFHAEAEAAANLDHPGIVPIYEVGEVEGQHYFSMGYVDGVSLAELIAEHPLPPEEAAEFTLKIAEAIGYAHEQGVIHRDLKPANVLVPSRPDNEGSSLNSGRASISGSGFQSSGSSLTPRVTDFGLAKQVQGDEQLTASGQILGTPNYMPPEQASGKTDEIDQRADIYSLGGILYALITGRPPFQAANQLDTLMQVLEKEPVPPRQLDSKLPRDIETIALKALEKDPKRRYQTALEMADDLRRFLGGEPILARSITSVERAWRWAKRKPVVASLGALAAALLLVVSIGGPLAAVQQSKLRSLAEDREEQATLAKQAAEQFAAQEKIAKQEAVQANEALGKEKERAERTLYARTVSLAYQAWHDDNVARTEDLLNKTQPEFRDWEWDFIKKLCHSENQTLRGHTGIPFRMRLSSDGKRMVSIGRVHGTPNLDVGVYLWDMESGTVVKKYPYRAFDISADANVVALETISDGPVVLFDPASGKELRSIPAHGGGTAWASFNSDGSQLVTTGPDKTVRIWDTKSGKEIQSITDVRRRLVHDVRFSPDDKRLYWKTFDGMIQIYDVDSGKKVYEIEDRIYRNDAVDVAISPDNKILAAASNGPINLFDVESGEKVASLFGHRSSVLSVCFSPDGKRLVSSGLDGTIRVWDVAQRREVFRYRGHKFGVMYGVWEVAYTPDGQWILSGGSDTTIKIWSADGGDGFLREHALATSGDVDAVQAATVYPNPSQEKDWLVGNLGFVESVAFSPDSTLIATASSDDTVRLFDLKTREQLHVFEQHDQNVGAVAFSPDGKLLASGEGGVNDSFNGKLMIWNLEEKRRHQMIQGHSGPIAKMIFSHDGKVIYSVTGSQRLPHRGELIAWNFGAEKTVFENKEIAGATDMALSPDGTMLAVATYTQPIHLIDAQTGELIRKIGGPQEAFHCVGFSPDGKRLATGKRTWDVGVWDVQTGQRIWEKIDHSGLVMGVAFTPNGRRVVSGGVDKTTRIWDAESGDMLVNLRDESFETFDVAISPDGSTIATFGEAPFVTIRDLAGNDASLVQSKPDDQWQVIFSDDFERAELGETWTVANGKWEIEDGAAKGTMELLPAVPIPNFCASTMIPQAWLPSVVEIEFDAWAPEPCLIETKLVDEAIKNAMDSLFIAMPQPYFNQTRPGGALVVQAAGGYGETARTGARDWFQPNQKYRLKTIRRRGQWEMFVNGEPLLQAEVPDRMWAPVLHLQAAFGKPGDVLFVDNLVVRAPESVMDEATAANMEYSLRQELKLKSLVIDAIKQDDSLSDSVKELALRYANAHEEDASKQQQIIRETLLDDEFEPERLPPLVNLLREQITEDSEDWETRQLLAAALYRTGDYSGAMSQLKSAEQLHQDQLAMSHPTNMALLALTSVGMDSPTRVSAAMSRLKELMRSEHWQNDENVVAWNEKAIESIQLDRPSDPGHENEIESIKKVTFEPMQQALCYHNVEPYFAAFTNDAVHIEGRTKSPNRYDVEVLHPQWADAEGLFLSGSVALHTHLVRSRADVEINGDEATLTGQYTASMPFGHWRWEADIKLKKVDGDWRITRERRGLTGYRISTTTRVRSPEDWNRLDEAVKKARTLDDDMKLLQALSAAYHRKEALEVINRMVKKNPDAAHLWAGLADRAYSIFDAQTMRSAGTKAVTLQPGFQGNPFLRVLSFETHAPKEPIDLGSGIQVKMPESVPEAPIRDFAVPGKVLRAWYPSNRSALLIFFAKGGNDVPLEQGMADLISGLKANLSVSVLHKELHSRLGRQVADIIFEGAGAGRSMSKTLDSEAKGTIQRWVIVPRGDDLVGMLLTSSLNEFDQRNSEFEAWLRHVQIQDE